MNSIIIIHDSYYVLMLLNISYIITIMIIMLTVGTQKVHVFERCLST